MFDTPYDKKIADEVRRLNKRQIAHMKKVGRGLSGGALSGGAGLADLLQLPMQLMSLPLKMMGLGGAVPVGAGMSGGAMSGGAGLADLLALPMSLLQGVLGGGHMPTQELRFGSNPATWSPNMANYAKGHGVYGGASSGGAACGGRKRRVHHMKHHGGALLHGLGMSGGYSSGGALSGGKGPSAKSKAAAGRNPWIAHVKKVAAEQGIPYREALKVAKHSYK